MTTLEKVMELKKEGKDQNEIISNLKKEGISPMEINDALNQSKIKEAISDNENTSEEKNQTEGMTPSIMGEDQKLPSGETYRPAPNSTSIQNPQIPIPVQEETSQEYAPQEPTSTAYEPEEYYEEPFQEEYGSETYSQDAYSMNSDTMIEVAEQVFSEKIKKLEETIRSLNEFKTIFESKVENISQRLKRIENQFDKTQMAILDRVGSFGKNMTKLQKEVNMVEESFEKMNAHRK